MGESLTDMLNWARYMDHGIRELEYSVERNCVQDGEKDLNEVKQKFEDIIDDARRTKISAQNDVEQLKVISDELRELISSAESEEMQKIDLDLRTMLDTLFPNEASIVEELVPPIETEQDSVEDGNSLVPVSEAADIPSPPNQQPTLEESYTEVEITPGLMSKIPKSRLVTSDFIPSSAPQHYAQSSLHPIRKRTLVFSPGDIPASSYSPIPETNTPQVVLQDRTNLDSASSGASAKALDSPEVLERPTRPVLTSNMYQF